MNAVGATGILKSEFVDISFYVATIATIIKYCFFFASDELQSQQILFREGGEIL